MRRAVVTPSRGWPRGGRGGRRASRRTACAASRPERAGEAVEQARWEAERRGVTGRGISSGPLEAGTAEAALGLRQPRLGSD